MKANLPKAVFGIHSLIATNTERFSYYQQATGSSKDIELKLLFMKYAIQAQSFNTYLNSWLSAYGASYSASDEPDEILKKWWSQIRHAASLNARSLMLKECDQLESNAIKKYQTAVTLSFFPAEAEADIKKQASELEAGYQNLQELRAAVSKRLQAA